MRLVILIFIAAVICGTVPARGEIPEAVVDFVENHCLDCHRGDDAEAGLDLESLSTRLDDAQTYSKWVKAFDRVNKGEMPPADFQQPTSAARAEFVGGLRQSLAAQNRADQARDGRVQYRRLNRAEYESTLRDLLSLPNLEVAGMLPPDNSFEGFDNVGSALDLSYVQISRYLEAANKALDEAMMLSPRPQSAKTRLEAKSNGRFSQVLRKGEEAVPIGDAVGLLRQPNTAQAPWWWSKFAPPIDGYYRLRMKTFGFIWDQGEARPADRTHAVTYHAVQGSTKRPLGTFDIGRSEKQPSIHEFTAFLRRGDQIQLWFETLDDRNKGRQRSMNEYTAPGVAVDWIEIEGPLFDEWPPRSFSSLFGDLPMEAWTTESGLHEPPLPMIIDGVGKRARLVRAKRNKVTLMHVVSERPKVDARRLLTDFARRAFRRPVETEELPDIIALVESKLDEKYCFQEAMRAGFQAILCSPEFLFFHERPGRLDSYALASRLSYFLWSSLPDEELLQLARDQTLRQPDVLRQQVDRMLADARSSRFVDNFCGQWLDLRRITITQPDEELYPEFDQLLLDSMVRETKSFFTEMISNDLSVTHLVDSDFVMINGRLAEHYFGVGESGRKGDVEKTTTNTHSPSPTLPNSLSEVEGVAIRKVPLPQDSPRGGLLTQASLLKVTANGTTTSPVTRGAWVLDRIYGQPARLPPPNVPAIEPDLRGATTIREQLDRHRNISACASCHRMIDPPGFALENFDVIGGWRDRYRSLEHGDVAGKTFKNNRPVRYKLGPPVDSSGKAPDGNAFRDINGFRKILLTKKEQLARNVARRLLVYSTGSGIQFADQSIIEEILARSQESDYGLRTLIHEVVQSAAFQSK